MFTSIKENIQQMTAYAPRYGDWFVSLAKHPTVDRLIVDLGQDAREGFLNIPYKNFSSIPDSNIARMIPFLPRSCPLTSNRFRLNQLPGTERKLEALMKRETTFYDNERG